MMSVVLAKARSWVGAANPAVGSAYLCVALGLSVYAYRQNADPPEYVASAEPMTESLDTVEYLGRTHYRIGRRYAKFLLDSASGGLSSMIDEDGHDWIAFRQNPWNQYPPSAASAYRGVPNLVFRGEFDGAGHPGHDKVTSRVISPTSIECHTPGGPWAWSWTFADDHAALDVTGVSDTSAYWFLYEGPAGGTYQPRQTYMASDQSAPAYPQLDHFKGQEEVAQRQWYYFGVDGVPRVLYIIQATADTLVDHFSLLGNDSIGIYSPDGMVVAGFGRAPMATPKLRKPQRFVIGFLRSGQKTGESSYEMHSREIATLLKRYEASGD